MLKRFIEQSVLKSLQAPAKHSYTSTDPFVAIQAPLLARNALFQDLKRIPDSVCDFALIMRFSTFVSDSLAKIQLIQNYAICY